jgi:hypothetical protein
MAETAIQFLERWRQARVYSLVELFKRAQSFVNRLASCYVMI